MQTSWTSEDLVRHIVKDLTLVEHDYNLNMQSSYTTRYDLTQFYIDMGKNMVYFIYCTNGLRVPERYNFEGDTLILEYVKEDRKYAEFFKTIQGVAYFLETNPHYKVLTLRFTEGERELKFLSPTSLMNLY